MKAILANGAAIRKCLRTMDIDWIHITDGYEGAGKTTFTWQLCKAVDPTFTSSKNIIFTEDQFREAIRRSTPGQALMLDEGALILYKRDAMTKGVKKINRLLTTIRAKNLFIAINAPDFKNTLDKFTIEHRARSLARIMRRTIQQTGTGLVSYGTVHWYTQPQILQINIDPKTKQYVWPEPRFKDTFYRIDPDSGEWEEYKRRKSGVVDRETDFMSIGELAGKLGNTPQTIYGWLHAGKIKANKIGNTYTIPYSEYERLLKGEVVRTRHNKFTREK